MSIRHVDLDPHTLSRIGLLQRGRGLQALRTYECVDSAVIGFLRRHAETALRLALAIVFIWFGALKPLGASPANELVARTVPWFDPAWFLTLLGVWEVLIGLCMLWRPLIRASIALLALQRPGTFLPLVLLPDVCFQHAPWAPSLEGQYIIKNLVLVAAGLVVGATVRGGRLTAQPLRLGESRFR